MFRIRAWVGVTILWLLVLFNVERFHEPINIASFVYVLSAVVAFLTVVSPYLRRVPTYMQLCALLGILVSGKWLLGYTVIGGALPLTITETCVLAVTLLLAGRISREALEFEASVRELTLHQFMDGVEPVTSDYSRLYREVRRARQHNRPFGLIAISATHEDSAVMDRVIEEIQRKSAQQYVNAKLARVVNEAVGDIELISRHGNHFVVAVPEANESRLEELAAQFSVDINFKLGLKASIGKALFPSQEVTLSGLLDRAEKEMLSTDDFAPSAAETNVNDNETVLAGLG